MRARRAARPTAGQALRAGTSSCRRRARLGAQAGSRGRLGQAPRPTSLAASSRAPGVPRRGGEELVALDRRAGGCRSRRARSPSAARRGGARSRRRRRPGCTPADLAPALVGDELACLERGTPDLPGRPRAGGRRRHRARPAPAATRGVRRRSAAASSKSGFDRISAHVLGPRLARVLAARAAAPRRRRRRASPPRRRPAPARGPDTSTTAAVRAAPTTIARARTASWTAVDGAEQVVARRAADQRVAGDVGDGVAGAERPRARRSRRRDTEARRGRSAAAPRARGRRPSAGSSAAARRGRSRPARRATPPAPRTAVSQPTPALPMSSTASGTTTIRTLSAPRPRFLAANSSATSRSSGSSGPPAIRGRATRSASSIRRGLSDRVRPDGDVASCPAGGPRRAPRRRSRRQRRRAPRSRPTR